MELFRDLNISGLGDYTDLLKQLQAEYSDTLRCLTHAEEREKQLLLDCANSKAKIVEDTNIISQLYEEISSLKTHCRSLRTSLSLNPENEGQSPRSQTVLKENKGFGNIMEIESPKAVSRSSKFLEESS